MGRQRGAASTVLAKTAFFARAGARPGKVAALRSATFSRASAEVVAAAVMTLSLPLSLPARAARDFFARLTVLSTFAPFFEPWRGSV